jgi:hypothetical protein
MIHHYDGNTCVSSEYVPYVQARLDRETDRTVILDMTPEMARFWARGLMEYADMCDRANKD